ncbi:SDR family oxidoreductase [Terasakiella sp. A23]|uniref:SDR family oxidoreductase n=1 Tax=Terasakiella sp. FCG-A23 TaxID=3080561 RepID=UPI002954B5F1|nr:SDR family oxidoreductase [Terasakiella sp. A23]MDV7340709.1 SDR family oxidoreductase [Terasakiella sp. A23]
MSKIQNKTALVTGANRGIGRAFVQELIKAGATKVYATARNTDQLKDLVEEADGKVIAVQLDVTNEDNINQIAKDLTDVELLINNAGIAGFTGLLAANDISSARAEMETNYFGVLNMVRAFAPTLKNNGGGAIVNLASVASIVNFPVLGTYSASKAAVHSLTQGIRAELAAQNTQVTGVYPGPVDTDMAADFPMDKTAPSAVVQAVFDGVENGVEDVFPDPVALEMQAGLSADPKAVEKQAGEMLPA